MHHTNSTAVTDWSLRRPTLTLTLTLTLTRLHAKIAKHNAEQDAALRVLARDEASSPTRPSPTNLLEERC